MKSPRKSDVVPAKRRRLNDATETETDGTFAASASLSRPVSPPLTSRQTPVPTALLLQATAPTWSFNDVPKQTQTQTPPLSQKPPLSQLADKGVLPSSTNVQKTADQKDAGATIECIASPVQLTRIRDLAPHQNADTVQLKDILGDPLIKECWNFNFLFDIDFVMQQFDEDVRDLVKVKIIHGFWKRDDERRIGLLEMAERYPNIDLIGAYLPDPFGTHHSKMLVLFRHDDHAQIIIHTANMIPKDWTNMTQAVWQSPLLPLSTDSAVSSDANPIGSGNRFRTDLIRYLHSYEKRLHKLTDQLTLYDFSGICAAFLGSAPSREVVCAADPSSQTSFGWVGLQQILGRVPSKSHRTSKKPPHIVLQVSSIATLGVAPTWLSHLQSVLAQSYTSQQTLSMLTPKFNIIFPTAEEVRTSLDGYASGGSIHTKVQSVQQQKQLRYLHPLLCHWKSQRSPAPQLPAEAGKEAHRGPAAPHIKTYIRFSDAANKTIDWALVTSANLSKQAWGDAVNKEGAVRIQSYETGVLVWPELFASPNKNCEISMVPVFGNDVPSIEDVPVEPSDQPQSRSVDDKDDDEVETEDEGGDLGSNEEETEDKIEQDCQERILSHKDKGKCKVPPHSTDGKRILVGFRMPYDLPLSSYDATEVPWCATQTYTEPDWKGRAWRGF